MSAITIPAVNTPTYQSWSKNVADHINQPIGAHCFLSNAGQLAGSTYGVFTFTLASELRNVGSVHDSSAGNTSKFRAKEAGFWHVGLSLSWGADAAQANYSIRHVAIRVNSVPVMYVTEAVPGSFNSVCWQTISTELPLALNDVVEFMGFQNSAVAMDVTNLRVFMTKRFEPVGTMTMQQPAPDTEPPEIILGEPGPPIP